MPLSGCFFLSPALKDETENSTIATTRKFLIFMAPPPKKERMRRTTQHVLDTLTGL
jgi:hypothetical protein